MANFQTLGEFINSPFGNGRPMSDSKYDMMMSGMKLQVEGFTTMEKSYYIHMKIPSSSNKGTFYDVIIRFFPQNKSMEKELTLQNYWIQFFSNSPSFMYKYAVLYKQHGYLIENLYNKMDPKYLDTLPEKTNADMVLTYDKSLYIACKYLASHKFKLLTKLGVLTQHKKNPTKFFNDVASFSSIKLDNDLALMEKRLSRKIELDALEKKKSSNTKTRMVTNTSNVYKSPLSKTNHMVAKKTAGRSTSSVSSIYHKSAKKMPSHSTRKS